MSSGNIPHIDESVRHVGVSKLRELNVAKLRQSEETLVIQDNDEPLAVLLTYDKFLEMQQLLTSLLNTIDLLTEKHEAEGVLAGLQDVKAGRVRSLAEIDTQLSSKR
jgi:PHD/YefM family antitoxin component YafN of YafNO toxin-antitoxin module